MAKLGPWYRLAAVVLKPIALVVTGREWHHTGRIPAEGGIIVVANHNSYYDPIVISHVLHDNHRPPRFLAKSGLFDLKVIGRVLRGAKQIPVYRQSAAARDSLRDARAALEAGEAVVIYPEGTLTRDPAGWPMTGKSGAARLALTTTAPVIPIGHWGANAFLPAYSKRPHFIPRATARVSVGEPVDLSDLRADEPSMEQIRLATERIMNAITAQVAELRGEPAPTTRYRAGSRGEPPTGDPKRRTGTDA